jgi:hypothetical protein
MQLLDITSPVIRDNKLWHDFVSAVDEVFINNIELPIDRLASIRESSTDKNILELTARLLGFSVDQNVLALHHSKLNWLLQEVARFSEYGATSKFVNFLDLALNGRCTVIPLYTMDYTQFEPDIQGDDLRSNGGEWWLTTHVDVDLVVFNRSNNDLLSSADAVERLKSIVYQFSPVNLVIRNFTVRQDVSLD